VPVCLGEELDISHPVLTELDTSQFMRSYIGVELTSVDPTNDASTSDDADSSHQRGFYSGLELSTSTDNEDDIDDDDDDDEYSDDDGSLHIRDEACQTDVVSPPASESSPPFRYRFPVRNDRRMMKLIGGGGGGDVANDGEVSVWRTLLHNDDADCGVLKPKADDGGISRRPGVACGGSVSGSEVARGPVGEAESGGTGMSSGGRGVLRERSRPRLVRSRSDSSLVPSASAKIRTLPVTRRVIAALSCGRTADLVGNACGWCRVRLCCGEVPREDAVLRRWKSLSSFAAAAGLPAPPFPGRLTGTCCSPSHEEEMSASVCCSCSSGSAVAVSEADVSNAEDPLTSVSSDQQLDAACRGLSNRNAVAVLEASGSATEDPLTSVSSDQLEASRSSSSAEEMSVSICRGLSNGSAVAVSGAPVSSTEDPLTSVSSDQLEASRSSTRAEEERQVSAASLSDITTVIRSSLPADRMSEVAVGGEMLEPPASTDVHIPAADGTQLEYNSVRVGSVVVAHAPPPPLGRVCVDHQMCSLLADFVTHL